MYIEAGLYRVYPMQQHPCMHTCSLHGIEFISFDVTFMHPPSSKLRHHSRMAVGGHRHGSSLPECSEMVAEILSDSRSSARKTRKR